MEFAHLALPSMCIHPTYSHLERNYIQTSNLLPPQVELYPWSDPNLPLLP